jgi:hypothetical protein
MSCNEWEGGEIKIPARQWKSFVAEILAGVEKHTLNGQRIEVDCGGEACYILEEKDHTLIWDVPENNHAREHAREEKNAKVLFNALRNIKWVRGSGGDIVGNDEYHREDRGVGGGGNYLVQSFGPDKKRKRVTKYYGTSSLRIR